MRTNIASLTLILALAGVIRDQQSYFLFTILNCRYVLSDMFFVSTLCPPTFSLAPIKPNALKPRNIIIPYFFFFYHVYDMVYFSRSSLGKDSEPSALLPKRTQARIGIAEE